MCVWGGVDGHLQVSFVKHSDTTGLLMTGFFAPQTPKEFWLLLSPIQDPRPLPVRASCCGYCHYWSSFPPFYSFCPHYSIFSCLLLDWAALCPQRFGLFCCICWVLNFASLPKRAGVLINFAFFWVWNTSVSWRIPEGGSWMSKMSPKTLPRPLIKECWKTMISGGMEVYGSHGSPGETGPQVCMCTHKIRNTYEFTEIWLM